MHAREDFGMSNKLKPIEEQVIVITGASSGIGLATAEAAASRGARLVLAARSDATLGDLVERLGSRGCEVISVHCDVADREEVEAVGRAAIARFGRIDTWVNNAGVGMYGRLDLTDEDDARRLFDVDFWGVVHGSMVALGYLRTHGGAIINVGSEVSEATVPLLGMYAAAKHAVKGFTDTLRIEIEEVDESPVCITLIEPTAVDTPFPQHARNYMDREPKLPGKPIDPSKVADAILEAAATHTRVKRVGAMSTLNTVAAKLAPGIADKMAANMIDEQQYDEPPRHPEGVLHQSSADAWLSGRTHGTGGRHQVH
jgi:short-subunit dehydrogenase